MNTVGYYAVQYGGHIRFCNFRTGDLGVACKDTYGLVAENMQLCYIGSTKAQLQSIKNRNARLATKEAWFPIPEEYLSNLERNSRLIRRKEQANGPTS